MNATVDLNVLVMLSSLVGNILAVALIVYRSNIRLESRLTKLETSFAFLIRLINGGTIKLPEE